MTARVQVGAAADLAALAGASASLAGEAQACDQAVTAGRRNDVAVESCTVSGAEVWVTVAAPAPASVRRMVPGWDGVLRARAHAALRPGSL